MPMISIREPQKKREELNILALLFGSMILKKFIEDVMAISKDGEKKSGKEVKGFSRSFEGSI